GIAKRLAVSAGDTQIGDVIGTPSYMAPEQAAGKLEQIGPATDIYGLGVILYEMLTGRVPLLGPTTLDTLLLIRTEEPVPPRRFQPQVPRDLETICLKCLQKDPADRYTTAGALADDLHRFLVGEPIQARPTPLWERAWKWARRRPAVASLSVAVVLVAAVGFALVAWQWQRAESKATAETLAKRSAQEKTRQAEQLLAQTSLTQGRALCDGGDIGRGLLWMVRSLQLATRSGDRDQARVARANMSAWEPYLIRPQGDCPHDGWAWAVAISPDGRTLATGGTDRLAKLWDTRIGQPKGQAMPHDYPVWAVAFSPDGKWLLTGAGPLEGRRGEARLWDASTGAASGAALPHTARVTDVHFSPNGRTFLTVCDDGAQLWSTVTRKPLRPALRHPGLKTDDEALQHLVARFSPDGRRVATGGDDGTAQLWEAATGLPIGKRLKCTGQVRAVAFSPIGRLLATGCDNGDVQLWDGASGFRHGPILRHRGRIKGLTFSPDGQLLAAGGAVDRVDPQTGVRQSLGGDVQLWRMDAGLTAGPSLWHPAVVWAVSFSPDGRLLMTASQDTAVRFFLPMTGQQVGRDLGSEGTVTKVGWNATGTLAYSSSAGGNLSQGHLWGLPGESELPLPLFLSDGVSSLAIGPDDRTLLTGSRDGQAQLWDLATGRRLGALRHGGAVQAVAFSPDGKTLLTGSAAGKVRLWDRRTLRLRQPPLSVRRPLALAESPDGKLLIVGTSDSTIQWRETATGHILGTENAGIREIRSLTFRDRGQTLDAIGDGGVASWDWSTRRLLRRAETPNCHAAGFLPDGRLALRVVNAGAELRDAATPDKPGHRLLEAAGAITSMVSSPDGRYAFVTGRDNLTRLWDLAAGQPVGPTLARDEGHATVVFSADSHKVAAGTPDGRVCVWCIPQAGEEPVEKVQARIELLTGLKLDDQGMIEQLAADDIRQLRHSLDEPAGGGSLSP
ncbi:MAG TPA: protein kinase, partial [Gemmataceae bacterium]|nr:protein kinase [Gemmataceae bacterium]